MLGRLAVYGCDRQILWASVLRSREEIAELDAAAVAAEKDQWDIRPQGSPGRVGLQQVAHYGNVALVASGK